MWIDDCVIHVVAGSRSHWQEGTRVPGNDWRGKTGLDHFDLHLTGEANEVVSGKGSSSG